MSQLLWDVDLTATATFGPAKLRLHGAIMDLGQIARPKDAELDRAIGKIRKGFGAEFAQDVRDTYAEIAKAEASGPVFLFDGELAEPLDLAALAHSLGWELPFDFTISRLAFSYDGLEGTVHAVLEAQSNFEILPGVKLQNLALEVDGGGADALHGRAFAALCIGENIQLEVTAGTGATGGDWILTGHATQVPIGQLIAALPALKKANLGAFAKNFELHSLEVAFDGGRESLEIHCAGVLDGRLDGTLALLLSRSEKTWELDLSGCLEVALGEGEHARTLRFDLSFASGAAGMLVAAYDGSDAGKIDVAALLSSFDSNFPLAPGGLTIEVPRACLVRRPKGSGLPAAMVAGIGFKGGLDLTAIRLPGLGSGGQAPSFPLIGELDLDRLAGPMMLSLDVLFSSADLAPTDPILVYIKTAGFTPPKCGLLAKNSPAISAALQIGETPRQELSWPLSLEGEGTMTLSPKQGPAGAAQDGSAEVEGKSAVDAQAAHVKWFEVHKAFGPLHFERVGVAFDATRQEITGSLEAAVSVAGLTISLDGLSVSAPIGDLTSPQFGLSGLGLSFTQDKLEISGAFLSQKVHIPEPDGRDLDGFAGIAVVRTPEFSLSASGAYVEIAPGEPSMMLYAVLDYPLGGPGFFFVTGLAAGFGYNRAVVMPDLETLDQFPLVSEVICTAAGKGSPDPMAALTRLGPFLPPTLGAHFLAVGLRFTSFKVVDSFALAIGRVDPRFELDLLGVSTIVTPPDVGTATPPLAKVRIAWQIRFVPNEATLDVRAKILPGAYCFSKDAHLTGGYAFSAWFTDKPVEKGHDPILAGDFVNTVGGYHPAYKVPDHYPRVDPLELTWKVNPNLLIKGKAYFALTSHAVMAGGMLDATWTKGDLQAHFVAALDLLLCWEPYHYDADIRISIDIHATIHFFGTHVINLHADARLHVWGPEFGGRAEIHARVIGININFQITFGNSTQRAAAIDWERFVGAFVPDPCSFGVQRGLLRTIEAATPGGRDVAVVAPADFTLVVNSGISATHADQVTGSWSPLGIPPMGIRQGDYLSRIDVKVYRLIGADRENPDNWTEVTGSFHFSPITQSLPAALWGVSNPVDLMGKRYVSRPGANAQAMIENVLTGLHLHAERPTDKSGNATPQREFKPTAVMFGSKTADWAVVEDLTKPAKGDAARDPVPPEAKRAAFAALGFAEYAPRAAARP
jgi:hypothetical protein